MEVDVFGVGDVRRSREAPARCVDRAERREFGPAAAEVVTTEEVRGLRAGVDAYAPVEASAGETVHVVLGQALGAALPGATTVVTGEQRAVLHPGEDMQD